MGMSGYFSALVKKYPSIAQKVPPLFLVKDPLNRVEKNSRPSSQSPQAAEGIENIYIDLNNLLYTCARKGRNERVIFHKLFDELDLILEMFRGLKNVFIAVDGVGN